MVISVACSRVKVDGVRGKERERAEASNREFFEHKLSARNSPNAPVSPRREFSFIAPPSRQGTGIPRLDSKAPTPPKSARATPPKSAKPTLPKSAAPKSAKPKSALPTPAKAKPFKLNKLQSFEKYASLHAASCRALWE